MITTVTKTNGSSNPATKARMQAQPQSQGGLTSNIKPQRQKTSSTTVFLTVGRQEGRKIGKRTEKIRACKQTQTCSMNRTYSSKHTCKKESTQQKIKITIHTEEKHNCTYRYQAFKSISQSNQNSIKIASKTQSTIIHNPPQILHEIRSSRSIPRALLAVMARVIGADSP